MTDWRPTQTDLYDFVNAHDHIPLAYLSEQGAPRSATVAFSMNDRLELFFGTSMVSRKYAGVTRDPRVAFTLTDVHSRCTVQYEGQAVELGPEGFGEQAEAHYLKLPGSLDFKDIPGQAFFRISPSLIRASDCYPPAWIVTVFEFA